MKKLQIDTEHLLRMLQELARITDCPQHADPSLPEPQQAVTRIVFTSRDFEARRWLQEQAQEAGLGWRVDAVGNTFLRWEGTEPALPAVATGSHIDAIPFSGMYDGTVGVLGGLEAIRALRAAGFTPRRSLELILFTSEEPTRFGIGCLGSRLLSGSLEPFLASQMPDRLAETQTDAPGGGSLGSVLLDAGLHGDLCSVALPSDAYAAFVEMHIEQGPLLERDGVDLGIVTAIAGPASYRITVEGFGGHAGALLMPDRRDALCAAAEIVLAVEHEVREANRQAGSEETVGTVGKLDVYPGAVNAVPSRVTLQLDLRSTRLAAREGVLHQLEARLQRMQRERGVQVRLETVNADPPTTCAPEIVAALEGAAQAAGLRSQRMISRAYHDSSFMALRMPVAMLFLPCRNGVSHRPDEYTSPQALRTGTQVLALALAELAGDGRA